MHDKETGERPAAKPGLSGWVEGLAEDDDGYLPSGTTIDVDPVSRSVTQAEEPDDGDPGDEAKPPPEAVHHAATESARRPSPPPPPRPPSSDAAEPRNAGRRRLVRIGLVGLAVILGLLVARRFLPSNQTPDMLTQTTPETPPHAATATPSPTRRAPTASSGPSAQAEHAATVKPPDTVTPPAPAAASTSPLPGAALNVPAGLGLSTPMTARPAGAPSEASVTVESRHTLDDLHTQLSTLETQMAGMRDKAKNDTAANRELKDQIVALHRALHDVYERMGKLTGGMASAASGKAHQLHGYRLLAVVGEQAVVEELASGKAAVLGANGHLGSLTVYQVSKGQVVTNYGVF